jgi:hypothetical protein
MSENSKIEINIDASCLKDSSACLRKFYWSVVKGYTASLQPQTKLEYGTAFHKFLEHYYGTPEVSTEDCIKKAEIYYSQFVKYIGEDDFRTQFHLSSSLREYVEKYPRDFDNISGCRGRTEQKFKVPYWQNDRYIIYLCGTMDIPECDYLGQKVIVDHKTGNLFWSDKPGSLQRSLEIYFLEYDMGIQTMFYSWMDNYIKRRLLKLPDKFLPVVINGIFIKSPTKKKLEKGEFDGVALARSRPLEYDNEQMGQFEKWLTRILAKVTQTSRQAVVAGNEQGFVEDYNLAVCSSRWGLCKYFNVCSRSASLHNQILSANFVTKDYQPLAFGGGVVE